MRKIEAFHCDYCRKVLVNGTGMKKHEKNCLKNPANRACSSCGNFTRNHISIADGGNYETDPTCREGLIQPDPNNPKNRHGLRRDCEHWKPKHPGELE